MERFYGITVMGIFRQFLTEFQLFNKEQNIEKLVYKFGIDKKDINDLESKDGIVTLIYKNVPYTDTSAKFQVFAAKGSQTSFGSGENTLRLKINKELRQKGIELGVWKPYLDIEKDKDKIIQKIRKKFKKNIKDDTPIDYTYDEKTVTLKIGNQTATMNKINFRNFCNKTDTKSFGEISFSSQKKQSENDIEFNKKYVDSFRRLSMIYSLKNDVCTFPLINKTSNNCTQKKLDAALKKVEAELDLTNIGKIDKQYIKQITTQQKQSVRENQSQIVEDNEAGIDRKKWEEGEINTAKSINNAFLDINKDLKNSGNAERFYSCQVGGGDQSDVIVVKDIPMNGKYNIGKKTFDGLSDKEIPAPKSKKGEEKIHRKDDKIRNFELFNNNDEYFFVEVKKNFEEASYLKFYLTVSLSGENPQIIYDKKSKTLREDNKLGNALQERWIKNDDKKIRGNFEVFSKNIKRLVEIVNNIPAMRDKFEIKEITELPSGFNTISKAFNFLMLEYLTKYSMICSSLIYNTLEGKRDEKLIFSKNEIEKYLKGLLGGKLTYKNLADLVNKNCNDKFKRLYNLLIDGKMLDDDFEASKEDIRQAQRSETFLFNVENVDSEDMLKLIKEYYDKDHRVRYLQIGNLTIQLLDNEDPLNLGCETYDNVFKNEKYSVKVVCDLDEISLDIKLNEINAGDSQNKIGNISKDNIQNSSFITKRNENYLVNKNTPQEKKHEENVEQTNESLIEDKGDGISTSETASDKFEVEVTEKIKDFLSRQSDPKYNSLSVSHYDASDKKYWSDIKITNPKTEKDVWVETKLNKYANLGSSSWKFTDGKWSCTTLEDNDPLLPLLRTALETHGEKFVQFCRSYLKKDDIRLPKDLSEDLIDAWKRSGNIEDTENDVQFITDKIQIDDFGSKIAEYYKHAKKGQTFYMQVGDDLYVIGEDTNIFNFKTKSGGKLKTLSEAYRIGRIQFRAKGLAKSQRYYYSLYCDCKILADKENADEDYSCSFLDEEKWPVISDGEINERKMDYRLKSKEKTYKPDQNRYAFKNKSEKYGGDDYIYTSEIASRLDPNLHGKGMENWMNGPDHLDDKTSHITMKIDDGKDSILGIKELKSSHRFKDVIYVVPSDGEGMKTGDFGSQLLELTTFLGSIKKKLLVYMNEQDESAYVCNGMKAVGNDVQLDFEWSDALDYDKMLSEETEFGELNEKIGSIMENSDERQYAYHVSNVSPDVVKKDGFRSGLGNGGTDTNLFSDLYEQDYPKNYLFVSKEPWDTNREQKFKYCYKIDITDMDLSPDFGMLLENGAYHEETQDDVMFYWRDKDLKFMKNEKLKKLIEEQGGEILVNDMIGGETVNGDYFPDALYEALGSAVIDGDVVNEENRIVDVETRENSVQENMDDYKFMIDLPEDIIKNAIDNSKIENTRYDRSQFAKYFGIKEISWCALINNEEYLAIAALQKDNPFKDYVYVSEIQSFRKGFGKPLLEEIIKKYGKVWLMANTMAGEKLLEFYRKLNLEEMVVPNSVYGMPAYFYYTKDCEGERLENYIIAFYSEDDGNSVEEAEKDIGGDKSDIADDVKGIKIWIDDIREAPEGFKWFKKTREFIEYVEQNGTDGIELIDTDHDAGDYQKFGGDYIRCFDYLDFIGAKNITIHIHSANPVGANNIRRIISKNKEENNWREVRNTDECQL